MKKPNSLKHKELLEWYHDHKAEYSPVYRNFYIRVVRYGMSKEEAMVYVRDWKWAKKWNTDNNGRECSCCWVYKLRSEYHCSKLWYNKKTSDCIECRTKRKQEYRAKTNRKQDREYKQRKKLEIGQTIAFTKEVYIDWLPREDQWRVIGYRMKKGYLLESVHTGDQKYMSIYKQYGDIKWSYKEHYKIIEDQKEEQSQKIDKKWDNIRI